MSNLHILGINGEQTACDMCGRTDLERTVVVADEDGEIVGRYGTSCVDYVLGQNGKRRTTAQKVREIEECRKDAIYTSLHHFDADFDPEIKGQRRMMALDAMKSAIAAHNLIPIPATRKAIMMRIDKLAGTHMEAVYRSKVH